MQDSKPISTPLLINFKLSSSMSPSNKAESMKMSRVPYASAVESLMFAMICTRPNIAYCLLTEDEEPSNFHEAIKSTDVSMWMTTMQEEIEALH